jgi:hypothetical protein
VTKDRVIFFLFIFLNNKINFYLFFTFTNKHDNEKIKAYNFPAVTEKLNIRNQYLNF